MDSGAVSENFSTIIFSASAHEVGTSFAIYPLHRNLEPIFAVDVMVAKPSVIAHPVLIDILVESWLNPIKTILLIVDSDVTADTTPRTDAI